MMGETIFSHETPRPAQPRPFLTEKRWILFIYLPTFFTASTTLGLYFDERGGVFKTINLISILVLNILEFMWCRIDSRERSYKLHRFFSYSVIIFGILAVIYYLFRSRGFRGGLVSVAWILLYAVLLVLTIIVVSATIVLALILFGVKPPGFPA